jgi:hypothetical protein
VIRLKRYKKTLLKEELDLNRGIGSPVIRRKRYKKTLLKKELDLDWEELVVGKKSIVLDEKSRFYCGT